MVPLECWVSRKAYILDEACLNTVAAVIPIVTAPKSLLKSREEKYKVACFMMEVRVSALHVREAAGVVQTLGA